MNQIIAKAKSNRTRPAEIEGEPVRVKVYSSNELKSLVSKVQGGKDETVAAILSEQFLDESGAKIFTPEFFLSDDCTNVFVTELVQIFMDINSGTYKKK